MPLPADRNPAGPEDLAPQLVLQRAIRAALVVADEHGNTLVAAMLADTLTAAGGK